jgi:hypothetical protein
MATFHSFGKLRLHTETTDTDLEHSTTRLGEGLRTFQKIVCPAYQTYELPTEEAARARRKAAAAKKAAAKKGQDSHKEKAKAQNPTQGGTRRKRLFNMNTYKLHALGGYAKAIRKYGTMDNYNSQTVLYFLNFLLEK